VAIIKEYKVAHLDALFFKCNFWLLIILACISTLAIISNSKLETLTLTLAILITPCVFIAFDCFRSNVFSILTTFWLMIYIYIPLTFCSILGDGYTFGPGLNIGIPFSQTQYQEAYIGNLFYLFVCLLATFLGLSAINPKPVSFMTHQRLMSIGYVPIIILAVVSFYVQFNDILTYLIAKAESTGRGEGLIKFIFFDHAFLILAGCVLLSLYEKSKRDKIKQSKISFLVVAAFFGTMVMAGSKAGWMAILILFFLIPYSFLRTGKDRSILFLSVPTVVFVIIMSPVVYFLAVFYRLSLTSSLEFDLLSTISYIDLNSIGLLVNEIFTRLSLGGFDRFMLISTTFLPLDTHSYATQEFLPYLLKNAANLLLPGTPFIEAYAPSSQLFPEVVNLSPLNGQFTEAYLLSSINTQPYTIFGIFTILFGQFSPVVIFLYHAVLSLIFSLTKNFILRLTIIYFFNSAISSFGIEVAIGYAYHIIISLFFMYFLLLILRNIRVALLQFFDMIKQSN
jgi:hypothetical protein